MPKQLKEIVCNLTSSYFLEVMSCQPYTHTHIQRCRSKLYVNVYMGLQSYDKQILLHQHQQASQILTTKTYRLIKNEQD